MKDIQNRLLNIMKWFHDICDKEGLVYFAQGGTALGAVRHRGFIPWDDDIDVGMPREDYEKLKMIASKINQNSKYYIEFPGEKEDYFYPYCKIYDKSTTLIENTRYETRRGIYIDVFPIDGAGNSMEESVNNFRVIDRKLNFLYSRTCAYRKNRALYKNIAIFVMRIVPNFLIGISKTIKNIELLSSKCGYNQCKYVANFCGNWHEKEIMDKEWVDKPILMDFDGIKIYVPNNSHAYLTRLYGDYMQLPPKEKRKTHHDFLYIDLDKPYM